MDSVYSSFSPNSKYTLLTICETLGWEIPKYKKQTTDKKIIVFNHRPHKYKNYDWFLKQMDRLWEHRQDFEVWVPLTDTVTKPYMTNDKYDRFGYFSKLSSCYLGVSCEQRYGGWAISATDGMSVGVPYLFSDDDYYHELADDAGIYYKDDNQFSAAINYLLDNDNLYTEYNKKSLQRFEESKWENAINQFNDLFEEAIRNLPILKDETDSYKKILEYIRRKGGATKKEILDHMGWGVRIGFNGYRNRLRNEKTIRLTKYKYEVIK